MKVMKFMLKSVLTLVVAAVVLFLAFCAYCHVRIQTMDDTGLPQLHISTENGQRIVSKEEYVNCTVTLSDTDDEYCIEEASAGIRGRGNSTWALPKKPYRIKFDEKTSVFGEQKNKSWVLLAMYYDFSYIKDRLAFTLADALGTEDFVPSYNYVELYINGWYQGLYLMTDQVDENKGRANVKTDFTADDIEVPFLVELDAYAPDEGIEGIDYFAINGLYYAIKYPEVDERYTDAQFDYIKNYIETVDALCRKPDVTMSELEEHIAMRSFMDYYIVQELMAQGEINWKSVYMSKTIDGKLKMGPIWDFDWSVNGPYMDDHKNYNIDNVEVLCSQNNFFANLYNGSNEFRTALSERFEEVELKLYEAIEQVRNEKELIAKATQRDELKWHITDPDADFEQCSDEVLDWVTRRLVWMKSVFTLPSDPILCYNIYKISLNLKKGGIYENS